MRADLFWRPARREWDLETATYASDEIEVPSDATLCEILGLARLAGKAGKGTSRTGVNEVQTDKGIYTSLTQTRMDPSTERKMKQIVYRTWEESADVEDFYDSYQGPYSGIDTGNGHDEKGNYFATYFEELAYWFKTLDKIPRERSSALEKCKDFFKADRSYENFRQSSSCCGRRK